MLLDNLERDSRERDNVQAGSGPPPVFEAGSYRDRTGRIFYYSEAVYRALNAEALGEWENLREKRFFHRFIAARKLVQTEQVAAVDVPEMDVPEQWVGTLQHERIPFISYPYEWPFGMLQDAALLHLELLDAAIEEDVTIKDGTAFNVQWNGTNPLFIDIPSFQRLPVGEPWIGYRQFCQTFLYPLFLNAYKRIPFQPWLRGCLDGIEAEQCNNLMSLRDMLRPGVLAHVFLHAKLQSRLAATAGSMKAALPRVGFDKRMIQANVRQLSKIIRALRWKTAESTWSGYATSNSYSSADRAVKEEFVGSVVHSRRWKLVWDLGCNTGHYSRIAKENADYVVAMDGDHLAVERLYRALKQEHVAGILPLVGNVVDASPNLGWRGAERKGLRERGKPELTLCLALIHHLVIGANIPLRELLEWLAGLGTNLVIEFVTKADPMVQSLLRNKPDNYDDYSPELFERWLSEKFEIVRSESIQAGTRTLYYAVRRAE